MLLKKVLLIPNQELNFLLFFKKKHPEVAQAKHKNDFFCFSSTDFQEQSIYLHYLSYSSFICFESMLALHLLNFSTLCNYMYLSKNFYLPGQNKKQKTPHR